MFLLTVITLAWCNSVALSSDCYSCQNFEFENEFYDPNCSVDDYSGHTISCAEEAHCFTDVYEDGRLHRGCEIEHSGVQCVHHNYPHQTQCFCEGDLCNIDLCNGCIDGPNTKPTTETATVTDDITSSTSPKKSSTATVSIGTHEGTTPTIPTRPSASTSETPQTITTDITTPSASQIPTDTPKVTTPTPEVSSNSPEFTTPTSEMSTLAPDISTQTPEITTSAEISTTANTPTTTMVETTTPIKIVNITCYDCQSNNPELEAFDETCPEPGYNGNTYACDNCGSCFTEVHDDGSVIRGEAGDFTEECAYGEDYVACYCTKDLCNKHLCEKCKTH